MYTRTTPVTGCLRGHSAGGPAAGWVRRSGSMTAREMRVSSHQADLDPPLDSPAKIISAA
jgi:hypothetical protein